MPRLFPQHSRSTLLPLYVVLGIGNLAIPFLLPNLDRALGLFGAVIWLLVIGIILRLGPTLIYTLVGLTVGAVLAADGPRPWNPLSLAIGVGACGLLVGAILERVLSSRSTLPTAKNDDPVLSLRPKHHIGRVGASKDLVLAEVAEPEEQRPANGGDVPRRYDLSLMLVAAASCAVLFGVLQLLRWPPEIFAAAVVFLICVGAGQPLLFGGKRPRLASQVVGVVVMLLFAVIWVAGEVRQVPPSQVTETLAGLICFIPLWLLAGFPAGYVAGALIGGIFLAADAVRTNIFHAKPAETEGDGEGEEDATPQ